MAKHDARAHQVEERLRRVESPEPPADLIERIRGDIPDSLRPVADDERPASGRPVRRYRLLAASLALAAVGGLLAYRVFLEAPEPAIVTAERPPADRPEPRQRTTEVGPELDAPDPDDYRVPAAPPEGHPAPAAAEEALRQGGADGLEERQPEDGSRRRDAPAPAPPPPPAADAGAAADAERPLSEPLRAELERRRAELRDQLRAGGPPADLQATGELQSEPEPAAVDPDSQRAGRRALAPTGKEVGVAERAPVRTPETVTVMADRETARPVEHPWPHPAPSTGGTAEPNDQPYGDMFFRAYGTNPFVDTEDDPQSTFGLDVDTGSYTLARGYLERGHLPPPEAIRVEEFVNFFDYRDAAPRRGEFTLTVEGAPSPWARGPRYQLLRIGLHGREISSARRRDATLVFVVDVSGSMARENRIELVRRALHLLLDQLGRGDRVGLVVYGSRGRVLLEPTGDLARVRRAIDRLATGGSTNAEEGLVLGYELARRTFRPESINRVILCSDGVANVGRTGPESILERIGREAEQGIELTTVGFGMGNYNDVLMEQLADRGDGNYAYVDTLEEARRVFVEKLTGTLQTIASDAKVQVEFDPRVVSRYRLLGYENRDVADHRFRDDTVDAGEIGAGHQVTALYEVKLAADAPRRRPLGEVRVRYRSRATGRVVEDALEIRRSEIARSWAAASPALQLAAVAAELAEVLKGSYWAREADLEALIRRAEAAERELPRDPDVRELADLVRRVGRELAPELHRRPIEE